MRLNHCAFSFILSSITTFSNAQDIELHLGFSGIVKEAVCSFNMGEEVKVLSSPSGKQAASVKVLIENCSDEIINATNISIRDISDNANAEYFFHESGGGVVKGNSIEKSRFIRINPLEVHLPLIISPYLPSMPSGYTGLLHLSYD